MIEYIRSKEIEIKGRIIGGKHFTVIAGPCTVENFEELKAIVTELQTLGIWFFRGGAYKMRTSPHSFQGMGEEGLKILHQVAVETGSISVSEIVSPEHVEIMSQYIDVLQVGTRNMHNYPLLSKLGKIHNPIILKRGMSSTYDEWLLAAEHIKQAGNDNIILCERGIRTFDSTHTRNSLDISAIPVIRTMSSYPVIIDPSHSGGRRELVTPLSWAAAAAGADGLLMETHYNPDGTICDSKQTVDLEQIKRIIAKIPQLAALWHKTVE